MTTSIIIPLYNKEPFIARALGSISRQTRGDFEVIVVDDGSTDSGPDLVRAFPDQRVRLVEQANAGPGAARNAGARLARGKYLAFLDADDEWLPDFLEATVELLEAEPGAAMATSGYVESPSGQSAEQLWRSRGIKKGPLRLTTSSDFRQLGWLVVFIAPWSTVIRRERFLRWGGFFEREKSLYGEDTHLWIKILLNETVMVDPTPRVKFHTEASDLSRNLASARPVEPFLEYPEDVRACCPLELRPLLERFLAMRAFKTACMLGYWGQWRRAAALVRRFYERGFWRLPLYWPAVLFSTPVGPLVGRGWRLVAKTPQSRAS